MLGDGTALFTAYTHADPSTPTAPAVATSRSVSALEVLKAFTALWANGTATLGFVIRRYHGVVSAVRKGNFPLSPERQRELFSRPQH